MTDNLVKSEKKASVFDVGEKERKRDRENVAWAKLTGQKKKKKYVSKQRATSWFVAKSFLQFIYCKCISKCTIKVHENCQFYYKFYAKIIW